MRCLLTSAGIKNASIHNALVDLLGKPIAESSALIIPTAVYPFPGGARQAWRAICGAAASPLCGLGWKSMGVLELTALPSIDEEAWIPMVQETDALLVWGGDVLSSAHACLDPVRDPPHQVGVNVAVLALDDHFQPVPLGLGLFGCFDFGLELLHLRLEALDVGYGDRELWLWGRV